MLADAERDALLAQFRDASRKLVLLAGACEAAQDPESREGVTDTLAMLKEVQRECEERRAVVLQRQRERSRAREAAKRAALPHVPDAQ